MISTAVETLERHPNFLRLLIVFAVQPPAAATATSRRSSVASARSRWSACASRSRSRSTTIPRSPATDQLARFALAAFDGAFVASQADPAVTLERLLEPLAPALVAARRQARAKRSAGT